MKKLIITILLVIIATNCHALSLNIPFRCWESELIKEFRAEGINLDKTDPYGDGFIENCGANYRIHLYDRPDDMQPYIQIPRKVYIKMENTDGYRNKL